MRGFSRARARRLIYVSRPLRFAGRVPGGRQKTNRHDCRSQEANLAQPELPRDSRRCSPKTPTRLSNPYRSHSLGILAVTAPPRAGDRHQLGLCPGSGWGCRSAARSMADRQRGNAPDSIRSAAAFAAARVQQAAAAKAGVRQAAPANMVDGRGTTRRDRQWRLPDRSGQQKGTTACIRQWSS